MDRSAAPGHASSVHTRPFTELLQATAREAQRLCGADLTWKDADLELRASQPPELVQHRHRRCLDAKTSAIGRRACVQHCRPDAAFWQGRDDGTLVRRCHAGCDTVHLPVRDADGLLGTLGLSPVPAGSADRAAACARLLARTIALAAPLRHQELAALGPGQHPAVAAVLATLAASPRADLRAADLAQRLGLSASRLVHLLREQTGHGFTTLRRLAVMRRARALLAEGRPVGEVADRLGFAGATWFASAFRAAHGLPPSRWRARPTDQA